MEINGLPKRKEIREEWEARKVRSETQNPAWCLESGAERALYTAFRDHCLLPEMQYNIGPYFADFAFPRVRIVVEYDGPQHIARKDRDAERDSFLIGKGWTVFRIARNEWGYAVRKNGGEFAYGQHQDDAFEVIANVVQRALDRIEPEPDHGFTKLHEAMWKRLEDIEKLHNSRCHSA
jgi:very-short-patch-repair endonuclease